MPSGKLSAQSGHAYTDSLFNCLEIDKDRAYAYRNNGNGGSKVTLKCKNLNQLERALMECKEAGIPHALITDRNHILPPHFDGSPIITALGLGPCTKEEAKHITKRFRCV